MLLQSALSVKAMFMCLNFLESSFYIEAQYYYFIIPIDLKNIINCQFIWIDETR